MGLVSVTPEPEFPCLHIPKLHTIACKSPFLPSSQALSISQRRSWRYTKASQTWQWEPRTRLCLSVRSRMRTCEACG